MKNIKAIENNLEHLRKMEKVIDAIFGGIIIAGIFVTLVVCPIMMHITH